jgi:small GTP-binding protein
MPHYVSIQKTVREVDMTYQHDMNERIRKAKDAFGEPPQIIMTGKTGAGKSSLINALTGREVSRTDVTPCTQAEQYIQFTPKQYNLNKDIGPEGMTLIDVPGFAEADKHGERLGFILNKLPDVHLVLLVVGAPDRALEYESQFISDIREQEPDIPIIVVANKIDLLEPVRDWHPAQLNLKNPETKKEKNITAWSGEVRRACHIANSDIACVASGENFDDYQNHYGLVELTDKIVMALPEAARNYTARVFNISEIKKSRAKKIIWANAVAAAGVGAVPIPVADMGILCAIQAEMVVSIAFVYGIKMDLRQAAGILGPAFGMVTGPAAFQALIKYLPGAGTVAAAGTAGVITLAIGWTYLHFFIHGNFKPSPDEVKNELKKQYQNARNYKDQLKKEAGRKND